MTINTTVAVRMALAGLLALHLPCVQAGLLDQPMTDEEFGACVQRLAGQTAEAGRPLRAGDFTRVAAQARYDDRVRQALLVQRGEPTLWWDDLAATTDDERVAQGREVLAREAEALQRIEARWGIPREIVVAIYGIETNYGPSAGRIPVLDAALTLACLRPCTSGNCAARERAYAAVRLLRDGKVRPEISPATASRTSSARSTMLSPPLPTTCKGGAAGSKARPSMWRCAYRRSSRAHSRRPPARRPSRRPAAARCRSGRHAGGRPWDPMARRFPCRCQAIPRRPLFFRWACRGRPSS
jgi:hypothetical protein